MPSGNFVFAHLADAHVGAWSRDPTVRQALRDSVLRALEVVEERGAEFLLISGDLFHTPVPEPAEVAPVAAALRRLIDQGRRVYVIYGSHDYVAHRTSWLDVLAETGIFLKGEAESVRSEGTRWSLPFRVDTPTGARIAGISGRSQGLDREYFQSVDSEAFRAEPGFRIFQFHAAVQEFLPAGLREHIEGISVTDLPTGADYYAGGHIHLTYQGEGPGGGLLVNPGAVFGTSLTDLENGANGRSHQGVVIVTVRDGRPTAEFVDTAPRERVRVFDVVVEGKTADEARALVRDAVRDQASPGALLFPRLHGTLADSSVSTLGLRESAASLGAAGIAGIHWDVRDVYSPVAGAESTIPSESDLETEALSRLAADPELTPEDLRGERGARRLAELLRELGIPRQEGESRTDYESARVDSALRVLGIKPAALGPESRP